MRISPSLRLISSLFALTLMTTLVACGGEGTPPTDETTSDTTTEEMTETTAEEGAEAEVPEEEKPEIVQNLQETLLKTLGEQLPGTELDAISCPADAAIKAGATFDCDVTAPDGEFAIAVTIEDEEGNLTFKSKGIVSLVKLEETLAAEVLKQAQVKVSADCGSKESTLYLFDAVGETFECEVTNEADGSTQPAKITINSEFGEVSFEM